MYYTQERKVRIDIWRMIIWHRNNKWDGDVAWGHYSRRKAVQEDFKERITKIADCPNLINIELRIKDKEAILTLDTRDKDIMYQMINNLNQKELFGYPIN